MPQVSVIVPNYNHAVYLTQRIDSILSQSYQDFELIILDDCSGDDSKTVIETFRGHPKISHIIYNDENSGSTFRQWEKGIAAARGEFIWIAESDDWCEQNMLEELVSGIKKEQNCVISYCQSYCIHGTNKIGWVSQHPYLSEIIEGHNFIRQYLLMNNSIFNASMVLWKKQLHQDISREFLNYKFCGDWLFWIELARRGNIHVSGRTLNYFRKHENDVSGKATKSGLDIMETLDVLNIIYTQKLITDQDYNKAAKRHFRNYRSQKSGLDPGISKKIERSFQHPASSGFSYTQMLLSAIWHNLRRKTRS
ncbi:MAG TPA: glycosyltransferase family 2 protein [Pedobacter sp.]